jgi:hypothetical protein
MDMEQVSVPRREPGRRVIFDSLAVVGRRATAIFAEAESRWNCWCGDCRGAVLLSLAKERHTMKIVIHYCGS